MEYIYFGVPIVLVTLAAIASVVMAILYRRVVPPNMTHIVRGKTNTVTYGKSSTKDKDGNVIPSSGNTYYAWPSWIPLIGVEVREVNEAVFGVNLIDYDAYDSGRLPFVVDVTAFFRVEDPQIAAQRQTDAAGLQKQLESVLQGAVRRILSTNKLEEIMQDRSKLGDEFTDEVNEQLKEWGVTTVKSIEFMDIRDAKGSEVIKNMMAKEQSRIDMESRMTVAENKKLATNAEIDAQRTIDINKQEALQQVGIRTAQKDKTVGIENERARQEIQAEAKVTAERAMAVNQVNFVKQAEIDKEVLVVNTNAAKEAAIVEAEARRETMIRIAEGERDSATRRAEGDKQVTLLRAEANLNETLKQAEGIAATGTAKADAEKALQLAPVAAQITLAKEIGENQSYQEYLVTIRKVEAQQAIGIQMAEALKDADLKVIANSGDVQGGINGLMDVFSAKGGTGLAGMLAGLSQTDEGKALVDGITKKLGGGPTLQ